MKRVAFTQDGTGANIQRSSYRVRPVGAVEVSTDRGRPWRAVRFVGPDMGPYAWRQFELPVTSQPGSHLIASRAIAADGTLQPELRIENERGYAHNGWRDHAVAVTVA